MMRPKPHSKLPLLLTRCPTLMFEMSPQSLHSVTWREQTEKEGREGCAPDVKNVLPWFLLRCLKIIPKMFGHFAERVPES